MTNNQPTLSPLLTGLAALAFMAGTSLATAQTSAQDDSPTSQTPTPTQEDSSRLPPSQTPQPMQEASPESMPQSNQSSRSEEPAMPPEDTLSSQAGSAVPATVRAKFEALDVDHDGSIDSVEAAASDVLASQFRVLDTSGDGKLSLLEFAAASNLASITVDHAQQRRE
jgi:hypothetical protein